VWNAQSLEGAFHRDPLQIAYAHVGVALDEVGGRLHFVESKERGSALVKGQGSPTAGHPGTRRRPRFRRRYPSLAACSTAPAPVTARFEAVVLRNQPLVM